MSNCNSFLLSAKYIKAVTQVCCNSRRLISSKQKTNEPSLLTYTAEQQMHIIDTLQNCAVNNITRLHLNEKRLQGLKVLFEKNPNMRSLEPLLTVNGLGPKLLCRICDSIIQEQTESSSEEEVEDGRFSDTKSKMLRLPTHLITPTHVTQSPLVESVVGLHLGINTVSWARLHTAGKLDTWGVLDVSHCADKKYDVHAVWDLVTLLREEIPDGDIYVMENSNWSNVASIKKPMKYHILEAMITTSICSVFNQSDSKNQPRPHMDNRVYFLRPFTSSRLFRKVVGSERVSAQDVVQNMVDGVPDNRHQPLTFTPDSVDQYLAVNGSLRDNMSQALLLVVSFTELILLRNPEALGSIGKPVNSKKR
uniref:Transcription elongation factor, mitochondrial n=1 Tax=Graphocephala atropunctata TaxID=36148 RepID=A0A1B6M7L5_9HEMI